MNLGQAKYKPVRYFCLIFFIFTSLCGNAQHFNANVEAIIQTNDTKNDILEITGIAKNLTEANRSLKYELSVITSDANNNSSKNSQSGYFTLKPFETKDLSETSVTLNAQYRTIILLLIFDEDEKPIGTARKVYDSQEKTNEEKKLSYKKPNEGIELRGIVTENTKTKPGRDFYSFFYQKYSLNENKSNQIVEVDEMISFGRTTRIMVKIGEKMVFQFYARPKLDYLKEMANQALLRVNKYFEDQRKNKKYITQY